MVTGRVNGHRHLLMLYMFERALHHQLLAVALPQAIEVFLAVEQLGDGVNIAGKEAHELPVLAAVVNFGGPLLPEEEALGVSDTPVPEYIVDRPVLAVLALASQVLVNLERVGKLHAAVEG